MRTPRTPPPPPAPDPVATASAQGAANTSTAIASQTLNMVDQYTPDGSLVYDRIATETVPNGLGGTVDVPRYRATQTLSPDQQQLRDIGNETDLSLATIGRDQSQRIGDLLGAPIDMSGVPDGPSTIAGAGGIRRSVDLRDSLADVGGQERSFADVGGPRRSFADVGGQERSFADVGGPRRTVGSTDFSNDRARVEGALLSRMRPQLDRDQAALETRLINSGLRRGSEGWDQAIAEANRQRNDAYMSAIIAGGQEQSRLADLEFSRFDRENAAQAQEYGQARDRAGFANDAQASDFAQAMARGGFANDAQARDFEQARDRAGFANDAQARDFEQEMARGAFANDAALREAGFENQAQEQQFGQNAATANFEGTARDRILRELFALRNQPINEITALMSGSQVSQPNFTNTPQTNVAGVDYSGIVQNNYAQAMNAWNQENQQRTASNNAMMGGLFGLAGTLGGMGIYRSDRRLKRDVARIGAGAHGLPLYRFRYLWGDAFETGYMADEVARVRPDAVVTLPDGFLAVDYGKLEG